MFHVKHQKRAATYNIGKITSAFHREALLFCGGVWDSAKMFHVKHFGSFSK